MTLKVHYFRTPSAAAQNVLQSSLDSGISLTTGDDLPIGSDYHVLVTGRPKEEQVHSNPGLRAVIVPFAGIPKVTLDLMRDHPHIAVYNLHHNAGATAEMAITLLLSAAKFIVPYHQRLQAGDWSQRFKDRPSLMFQGKKALVLGYGEIGKRVALVCHALDMEVKAIRRSVTRPEVDSGVGIYPVTALHTLLGESHYLIGTLPLTHETEGMIAADELALMPKNSVVVNVGRGAVIDQGALYQALLDGTIAAAGIDVWYNYPENEESRQNTPPSEFPFGELPNVVMSPHRASDIVEEDLEVLRMQHLARLLNHIARGEEAPNRIDLDLGY
jgi:phosphoglycerate dehydrogenase-like enzyme